MLTRLDHAILAVKDLAAVAATYSRLGLRVAPGGEHPQLGTHNSIVRFGLDYLELVAVKDLATAHQSDFGRGALRQLEFGDGWVGYVVGTDDAASEAAALKRRGVAVDGPVAGHRRRPDGSLVEWRVTTLGPMLSRRMMPVLIEHLPNDTARLQRFQAANELGGHRLGARRLRSITLGVRDLEAALRVYSDELNLSAAGYEENVWLKASTAWLQIGPDLVVMAAPTSSQSPLAADLEQRGEGLFSIELEVDDLDAAVRRATEAGFEVKPTGIGRTVALSPDQLHGGRVSLSQA